MDNLTDKQKLALTSEALRQMLNIFCSPMDRRRYKDDAFKTSTEYVAQIVQNSIGGISNEDEKFARMYFINILARRDTEHHDLGNYGTEEGGTHG